ncbi:MAG: LysR family transcriptional regulator [Microbacterium sp.]|uniref:LysR family transcriptional regulator n=1 Tax=Microbacterium sp. TaxID=51671 RepID=UPI003A893E59
MAAVDADLNLLLALRALLEEENVTRAGARLGLGQSTMSSALSRLRTQFEDELLVRVGRDYELTPLARQLLPQVQLTLPLVAQALGQDEPFAPESTVRTFRIHLSDYAAIELRPLFALAEAVAPGIRFDFLRLPVDPADSERELLASDFVVLPPGVGLDTESIELLRDEYVVIADRGNPAVVDGEISLKAFLASPHIRCDFGRAHLTQVERRMHELDAFPKVRVTTSTLLSVPLIVAGTNLMGVVPRRLVARNAAVTGTVAVPTPFPTVELILRLWWNAARVHGAGHTWLRELAARSVANGLLRP